MSQRDNQYFSSVRKSAASSNTSDRFNMREPQGNKITTTDSFYHSMISSFVFMLMNFGLRAYSRPVRLERKKNQDPIAGGGKKTDTWLTEYEYDFLIKHVIES